MTYIAAFGCHEGIVMCADTQETVGAKKNYVEKLSVCETYPLAVGGAGLGELVDCLTDEIVKQSTEAQPPTKQALKSLIQNSIDEVYAMDLPTLVTTKQFASPRLLVAAHTKNDGFVIYRTVGRRVFAAVDKYIIGYESDENKHLLNRLHRPGLPMQQAVMLATYLVSQSKAVGDGVGGETRVVIVRDNGAWIDDPVYIKDAEERIKDFMTLTDQMFLTCIDVSIRPSEYPAHIAPIFSSIDVLRERYLQYAGARTIQRALTDPTYRGEPYPKVFPGSIIEVGESGPIHVRENTPEEKQRHKDMWEASQKAYNEVSGKRLQALLTGRTPLYLGDETTQVYGTAGPVEGGASS